MGHNKEGQTWKGTAIPKAWLKSCWRRGGGSPLSRGEVCRFAQASMGVQSPKRQATTLQGTDEPRLGDKWTEGGSWGTMGANPGTFNVCVLGGLWEGSHWVQARDARSPMNCALWVHSWDRASLDVLTHPHHWQAVQQQQTQQKHNTAQQNRQAEPLPPAVALQRPLLAKINISLQRRNVQSSAHYHRAGGEG